MKIHGICSYFGKNYSGWQKQVNFRSIQEEIEKVLSKVLNSEIIIQGSGRTDAGVHALNQHFHFEVNKDVDLMKLRYAMNSLLDEDIEIKKLEAVSDDFHARFSAKKKQYIFKIARREKDPFLKDLYWVQPIPFDTKLLATALKLFEGKHNFKNFTSKEEDESNFVRQIDSIKVENNGDLTEILFLGDGFMRYQIRFMVGVAMAVAQGNIGLDYIKENLDSDKPRLIINQKAPGQGLYLSEVFYD